MSHKGEHHPPRRNKRRISPPVADDANANRSENKHYNSDDPQKTTSGAPADTPKPKSDDNHQLAHHEQAEHLKNICSWIGANERGQRIQVVLGIVAIVISTASAVGTIAYWRTTLGQLDVMKSSNQTAVASVDTMKQANKLSADNFAAEQRPWISVDMNVASGIAWEAIQKRSRMRRCLRLASSFPGESIDQGWTFSLTAKDMDDVRRSWKQKGIPDSETGWISPVILGCVNYSGSAGQAPSKQTGFIFTIGKTGTYGMSMINRARGDVAQSALRVFRLFGTYAN